MSMIQPTINKLLDETHRDRFLLCSVAAKRADDINDMMVEQRKRALSLQSAKEVAEALDTKPLTMALDEIADGTVSYDPDSIDL